ncbi:recombinase family protein [Streptantibioticus silvisoli]|uniref:Recombinase family protein n=1 Tax=Streptantibioticus silvisoli TaxID=2705255 RepID=A0ABT6W323_9ACTN|nr:recombinase family protein [Streptantibioticus silvisoli]MDI5964810.1 recombinase family protein [Streptantibioticus silvisoli]
MKPSRAVLLLRISDDKAQDAKGVGRQEEDGRVLADRLGWGIAEVVIENDTSAYKRRRIKLPDGTTALRTVRPWFRGIIDKLTSGERDGLLAYDLDRVARDPRDLEDLIDVVESRDPRIPVESVTGSLRLATDADVTMARVMVAIANKSSRDSSRRVARKHVQLAQEGKPGGGGFRGYGYDRQNLTVVDTEAAIVREIAARILGRWDGYTPEQAATINPAAGESLSSIAADLERRQIPTVTGARWNNRSVRSVVTKARVAGLRTHKDEVIGEATWPAILDRQTWEDVCARIAERVDPERSGKLKRWLTGVFGCSLCGHMLTGAQGKPGDGPRYWCATTKGGCGKIAINAERSEAEVQRQILELLGQPRILEQLRSLSTAEHTAEARKELADDEQQLKELAGMWARKQITFPEFAEARSIINARVTASRALLVSAAPRILRSLLVGDVAENWERLEPAEKREVTLAIVPGYDVLPFDRETMHGFDPSRLRPCDPQSEVAEKGPGGQLVQFPVNTQG